MTNSIGIRRAEQTDMAACAGILNRWIDATAWMPRVHEHADVERYYAETVFAERIVLLAEDDGEIAGFLSLSDDHHVAALYIDERHRGAGIGARLIDTAKAMSSDELSLWTFEHNRDAQRFYEHQGFEAVRRTDGDNEEQLPDILYRWRGRKVRA
ncbi:MULTISPECIES: GNAT family N-acetyltransferase [Ensifer]|jgi:GNAT superfamily N-acetyltransferase|uniref:GNAT family N-acetyltransferase n=1 Tax=Ensifer adhaerens TaxID=106592 RepID=A0ABY8HDH1_ENSAD|nr:MULTISPECIES: GNAT family N-acetyltransferase [Ensifer]ANK73463.1 GCN5 family acetyltransferase [Ensifer adhaerens]KDP74880.1 GCN5 family acetyltransferase [Ensifer adhaerens]KQX23687.1 GCN5 family acetyltransferase [Ensifer sp. Root423]KQZ56628.1 GCN5 family acetyltransferase [Ensifer sp. Root558]MBD9540983.1 GNAT family N-acetyltransferase [Ensifer sp. ENS04]